MSPSEVFDQVFGNLLLFSILTVILVAVLYLSVRKVTAAGYFDPLHFYWTFTYGTAYALIAGLYLLGYISFFYIVLVYSLGLLFVIAFRLFLLIPSNAPAELILKTCQPSCGMKSLFCMLIMLYALAVVYQISVVGFGMFASTNRFEQARGNGVVIRFLGAIAPFLIACSSIYIYKLMLKKKSLKDYSYLLSSICLLFLFVAFNSILDGSKAAILMCMYSGVLGVALYTHEKPRFYFVRLSILFGLVLFFALLVQSFDLRNQNLKSSNARYLSERFFGVERLVFRIIGNGDKYYLGLPNSIVEDIETDNVVVRFIAPVVGSTNLSSLLGYNVNNYNVGRQILLQHAPGRETAGGPTSHFDLFAYKYFGLYFSWVWVVVSAFLLSVIVRLRRFSYGNLFAAAIGAQLWQSGLPMLLEPPIGVAKILDVLLIFGTIKLLGYLLPKKGAQLTA